MFPSFVVLLCMPEGSFIVRRARRWFVGATRRKLHANRLLLSGAGGGGPLLSGRAEDKALSSRTLCLPPPRAAPRSPRPLTPARANLQCASPSPPLPSPSPLRAHTHERASTARQHAPSTLGAGSLVAAAVHRRRGVGVREIFSPGNSNAPRDCDKK